MPAPTLPTLPSFSLPSPAPSRISRRQTGVTLAELLVVLAIVAILVGLAAPGFGRILMQHRLRSAEEDLRAALHVARSEAIRRGGRVTLRRASDGRCAPSHDSDWRCGWLVFVDDDGNGRRDPGETLIQTWPPHRGIEATISVASPSTYLSINRWGRFHNLGAFRFALRPEGSTGQADTRVLCMSSAGRLRALQGAECA